MPTTADENHEQQPGHSLTFAMSLVEAAIGQKAPPFDTLLGRIVNEFGAFGCIIWEQFGNHLFTLASWYPDGKVLPISDLPMQGSVSGMAIQNKQNKPYYYVEDVQQEGGPKSDHPFLKKHDIRAVLSIPITFHDGRQGSFDLHRTGKQGSFDPEKSIRNVLLVQNALLVASQLASFYQAHRDRQFLKLISDVNQKIDDLDWDTIPTPGKVNECIKEICIEIAEVFKALEVAVVLNDQLKSTGTFRLRATSWIGPYEKDFEEYEIGKKPSRAIESKTEWVIRNDKEMRLLDITGDSDIAEGNYEFFTMVHHPEFNLLAREQIQNAKRSLDLHYNSDELPPISYIAVPIRHANKPIGALRCCGTRQVPHYFSERDLAILTILAGKVGQLWASFVRASTKDEQLKSEVRTRQGIQKAVETVQKHVISEARPKFDLVKKDLVTVIQGIFLSQAKVLSQVEVTFASQIASPPDKETAEFPITVSGQTIGNLQARPVDLMTQEDHEHMRVMASLIGLSDSLMQQIGKQIDLKDQVNERYQEIAHQLKGPLAQARNRADYIYNQVGLGLVDSIKPVTFAALRGLCRKSLGVMRVLKVDTEKPDELKIFPINKKYEAAYLIKSVLEQEAYDYELLEPSKRITFDVDRRAIEAATGERSITIDRDFFEQVVTCLFDNAIKYSDVGTIVKVQTRKMVNALCIEVANRGQIKLSVDDTRFCIQRGWRSANAQHVTDAGKGIGLWLCHEILLAMKGKLVVIPTDATGWTRMQVYLPF